MTRTARTTPPIPFPDRDNDYEAWDTWAHTRLKASGLPPLPDWVTADPFECSGSDDRNDPTLTYSRLFQSAPIHIEDSEDGPGILLRISGFDTIPLFRDEAVRDWSIHISSESAIDLRGARLASEALATLTNQLTAHLETTYRPRTEEPTH